jgi:hypothetical protein
VVPCLAGVRVAALNTNESVGLGQTLLGVEPRDEKGRRTRAVGSTYPLSSLWLVAYETQSVALRGGIYVAGVFMRNTAFAKKIAEMTDAELERQLSSAFNIAFEETFGGDYEAHADAIQRHKMLASESKRRTAKGL